MLISQSSSFLRRVLLADALLAGAAGILMALLAGTLAPLLALPAAPLQAAGIGFVLFAVFVAMVGRARQPARGAVRVIIGLNVVGAAECLFLLLTGWVAPSALGVAFILVLALVMAGFAALEYAGLKRAAQAVHAAAGAH